MSLAKFLSSIGHAIGEEAAKIFDGVTHELQTVILPAAIAVTNALKLITDADKNDIIGHLLGKSGAAGEDKVRAALDAVVPKLQLAQAILIGVDTTVAEDSSVLLAKIVQIVGVAPAETKTAFWIEFAGLLTHALQTKLTVSQAVQVAQWFYTNEPIAAAGGELTDAPDLSETQPPVAEEQAAQ